MVVVLPSRIDSIIGLAWDSSRLIQPLLQARQSHFTTNLGSAIGQSLSWLPPRSANMRAVLGVGKRYMSHLGHASSFVDGLLPQNRHSRMMFFLVDRWRRRSGQLRQH